MLQKDSKRQLPQGHNDKPLRIKIYNKRLTRKNRKMLKKIINESMKKVFMINH